MERSCQARAKDRGCNAPVTLFGVTLFGVTVHRSGFGLRSHLPHLLDRTPRKRQSRAIPNSTKVPGDNSGQDADPHRTHGGFADLVGYELAKWEEDLADVALTVERRHLNRSGVMHGGVLSTLIDTACGYCGCYTPQGETPRRAFTLSLTCNFIGAAQEGRCLLARARRTGGGKSVFFADCEVLDEDGRVIGGGQGTFKYIALRK
ncbi:MAG: PaaI family thioesterase [Kiloniellaceae bacterium]